MSIIRLIKLAIKAIGRNRFRTFLTMLGIIIGVGSVITMLAIGQGSKHSIQREIAKMGSNMLFVRPGTETFGPVQRGAGSAQSLTIKDAEAIRNNCVHIRAISPEVRGSGQVIFGPNNWATSILGVDREYLYIRKLDVKSGEMFTEKDVISASKVCLLGKTVLENLFDDDVDPIGKTIRFNRIPFCIVGILEEKGDNTFGQDQDDILLAPYTTVQKRILAITHLHSIYLSTTNEEFTAQVIEEIGTILRAQHKLSDIEEDDFNVRSQKELMTMLSSTSQMMTILLASIAAISLLVGGIGIMNIMYVSVTERTIEIGLRLAVGARGFDIMYQFLIESVMISVTGGLIGIALGTGSSFAIGNLLGWSILVTTWSIALSFMVCAITGIFFGWYPAVKASRLDPIEALRYE